MENDEKIPIYYTLVPCTLLSLVTQPLMHTHLEFISMNRVIMECVPYLEVFLHIMQNKWIGEAFTTFYVLSLDMERLFKFSFWLMLTMEDIMDDSITTYFDLVFFVHGLYDCT